MAGHDLNINIVLRHQMIYCIWCERRSTLPYSVRIFSAVEGAEVKTRVTGKWSGDVPDSEGDSPSCRTAKGVLNDGDGHGSEYGLTGEMSLLG